MQLQRGGPLPGFYQPVEIRAPRGTRVSLAPGGEFEPERPAPRTVGLLIGGVYRLRVTHIRLAEGLEVYPTIEVINRTYAPPGQERRFAIPVDLTEEDLRLALDDKFVTRVIYLEDPRTALPVRMPASGQNWFDVVPGQDPLGGGRRIGPAGGHPAFGRPRAGPGPRSDLLLRGSAVRELPIAPRHAPRRRGSSPVVGQEGGGAGGLSRSGDPATAGSLAV